MPFTMTWNEVYHVLAGERADAYGQAESWKAAAYGARNGMGSVGDPVRRREKKSVSREGRRAHHCGWCTQRGIMAEEFTSYTVVRMDPEGYPGPHVTAGSDSRE